MPPGHKYTCSFEKSSKELFKFMKLFKITADLKLYVVIHELTCKTENCKYCDDYTLEINGNHFHVTDLNEDNKAEMTLLLPYEYVFHDVDRNTQYKILKYNELEFYSTEYSNAIKIDNDAEVVRFEVNYDDEFISFKDFLLKNDIHIDIDDDDEDVVEPIPDGEPRLKLKLVEV